MKKFIAEFNKQLIAALFFVLGSAGTGFVSHFLQDNSPQILVRQFYNSVEPTKAVPTQIGGSGELIMLGLEFGRHGRCGHLWACMDPLRFRSSAA